MSRFKTQPIKLEGLVIEIGEIANRLPMPPAGRKSKRQEAVKPIRQHVADIYSIIGGGLDVGEGTEQLPGEGRQ
jgi:hypothetical protein